MLYPPLISVRLAPRVLKDDIGERNAANRPEPSQGIADRQQGIRVETGRKAQSRLCFLLELQVKRRQCRPEAERSCHEQHVMNRWVD
jgi:hypothetical protein